MKNENSTQTVAPEDVQADRDARAELDECNQASSKQNSFEVL